MGGFQPVPGQFGPRYGVQRPPEDLVSSKTPFMNTLVDGINNYVSNFKGVLDEDKKKAEAEFLADIDRINKGIPVDMKKTARAARKAGYNFDYESPTPKQLAAQQQQQMMPQPQMQMPGGGMGAIPPQMGGGPPGGGLPMPMPQQGGQGGQGGPGFLGRLGNALRAPQAPQGDVPQDAPIMGYLQGLQQQAQSKMQQEQAKAEIIKTLTTAKVGSPEFMEAANRGATLGITKDIPDNLQMEQEVQQLATALKTTAEDVRSRIAAAKMGTDPKTQADVMMGVIRAGGTPESAAKVWQGILTGGLKASDFEMDTSDPKQFSDAMKLHREQYPNQPPQVWALMASLDQAGDYDGLSQAYQRFGPSKAQLEAERAEKGDKRADRAEGRADVQLGLAKRGEQRAEAREAERLSYADKQRNASFFWAQSGSNVAKALKIAREEAQRNSWMREDLLDLEDIIQSKSRGGMGMIMAPQPQPSAGNEQMIE